MGMHDCAAESFSSSAAVGGVQLRALSCQTVMPAQQLKGGRLTAGYVWLMGRLQGCRC